MGDVNNIHTYGNDFVLNTGSPHYVKYVEMLNNYNVYKNGNEIRNSETYESRKVNVNFVENCLTKNFCENYERGVEDETYSCGTGVTAAALTFMKNNNQTFVGISNGRQLESLCRKRWRRIQKHLVEGPAVQVFKGNINL
jgi:diaminopimelate epimerase